MTVNEYDFKIGSPVLTAEGEVGRLKYVVVDPDLEAVTHLVVERGRLLRRDTVVPVGWVEHADEHGVRLHAKAEELEELQEFREVDFWAPDPTARPVSGHHPAVTRVFIGPDGVVPLSPRTTSVLHRVRLGVGDDDILVRRGLPVYSSDGDRVATIDHLLVDPETHHVTHLVIHRGRWFSRGEDYLVPIEDVVTASEYGIRLRLRRDEVGHLPTYRPAASDAEIRGQLMRSLETQPETRGHGVRVEVDRGLVRLLGEVSEAVARAARELARRVRGVIGVEDRTTPPGGPGFRIGAPVFGLDGRVGELNKVVIDPHTRRVTHLVICRGTLLDEDRVVPVELVDRSTAEGIFLHLTGEEVSRQPLYREERFLGPPPGWEAPRGHDAGNVRFWGLPYQGVTPPIMPVVEYTVWHGIPEREIVLERGTEVRTRDGLTAEIDHLLVDPVRQELTHLIIRPADHPQHRVIVPLERVEDMGDGHVLLKGTGEELHELQWYVPPYSDYEIGRAVTEGFQHEGGEALEHVLVRVDRGLVALHGTTPTIADKAKAERIARSVQGVIAVRNELVAATATLNARVSAALAEDPHTAEAPIDVSSSGGTVTLMGRVTSTETRQAAERVARAVEGVSMVMNELEVRPHDPTHDSIVPTWLALPR